MFAAWHLAKNIIMSPSKRGGHFGTRVPCLRIDRRKVRAQRYHREICTAEFPHIDRRNNNNPQSPPLFSCCGVAALRRCGVAARTSAAAAAFASSAAAARGTSTTARVCTSRTRLPTSSALLRFPLARSARSGVARVSSVPSGGSLGPARGKGAADPETMSLPGAQPPHTDAAPAAAGFSGELEAPPAAGPRMERVSRAGAVACRRERRLARSRYRRGDMRRCAHVAHCAALSACYSASPPEIVRHPFARPPPPPPPPPPPRAARRR